MKRVLIIGSTGQIGSELTMKLRREIPGGEIVAGYVPGAEPKGELKESGPSELVDVRDGKTIRAEIRSDPTRFMARTMITAMTMAISRL